MPKRPARAAPENAAILFPDEEEIGLGEEVAPALVEVATEPVPIGVEGTPIGVVLLTYTGALVEAVDGAL